MAAPKRKKTSRKPARTAEPASRVSSTDLLVSHQQIAESIGLSIEKGRSIDALASACLRVLIDRTGVRSGVVYFEDEQTREMRLLAVCGDVAADAAARLFESTVARVAREGRALASAEFLAAPMKHKRAVAGVVAIHGLPKDEARVEKVAGLLDFFASRLVEALDHVRLIDKYAQKITRIQKMEEVSEALNLSGNEEDMLRRAIQAAIILVHAEAGSLLLKDDQTGELYFKMAVGEKGDLLKEVRLKTGQGIAGLVAQTGKAQLVSDAQHDVRVAHDVDLRTGFVTRNLIAVPIQMQGRVLGVLEAVNKRGHRPFSKWDLDEFSALSHQVALALEKTRLYRERHSKIERLQKLQEISGVLNSSLNPADIRKRTIEAATVVMNAKTGSLLLLDEAAQELYFDVALFAATSRSIPSWISRTSPQAISMTG